MIRLSPLESAEHEEAAIYVVNQQIPNVQELQEQLCWVAIRGYQRKAADGSAPLKKGFRFI